MMRKPLVKMNERQALERMSSRCAKSEQCEADVRRKLAEWEQDDAAADRIVERLRAEGFVDDERFCRAFVEDKWRFNRWGRTKIRMALRMKGMDGAPADEALAAVDDNEYREVLAAMLRENQLDAVVLTHGDNLVYATAMPGIEGVAVSAASDYERYQKLIRFALGRGFEIDVIKDCLNEDAGL